MSTSDCSCRSSCTNTCTTIALIVSVAVGIIAAFLRITAAITVTPAFLWVLLGIAVVYLAIVLLTSASVKCCDEKLPCCITTTLSVLLAAIIATVLFSVVLLGIEFVATSIIGAIITGLLLFSFFLTITETACLARCIITSKD